MSDEIEKQSGVCGQPCEVYSRVVGYLRPVQQWNKGKKAEYHQRRIFITPVQGNQQEDEKISAAMQRRFGPF